MGSKVHRTVIPPGISRSYAAVERMVVERLPHILEAGRFIVIWNETSSDRGIHILRRNIYFIVKVNQNLETGSRIASHDVLYRESVRRAIERSRNRLRSVKRSQQARSSRKVSNGKTRAGRGKGAHTREARWPSENRVAWKHTYQ